MISEQSSPDISPDIAAPKPDVRALESGAGGASPAGAPEATASPKPLTAEEQMALYEDSLKEDDWGHQPC